MSLSSQVESSPRPELSFPSARTKGDSAPLINTFHQPLVNKYERLSAENRAAERLRALCLCPLMETPVFENGAEITLDERLVFKFFQPHCQIMVSQGFGFCTLFANESVTRSGLSAR